MPNELSVQREIAAPSERVWDLITDIDHAADRLEGVVAVERLDGRTGFGVGTRWRETRRMFGKEATEEMAVTAVDDGRAYTVEADSRGARYVSELSVEALGPDRSRLTMTFDAQPDGPAARLLAATLGRLFAGATRKALQQDLDDIASAAEAGGRT